MEKYKFLGAILFSVGFGLCFYFGNEFNESLVVTVVAFYAIKSWFEISPIS